MKWCEFWSHWLSKERYKWWNNGAELVRTNTLKTSLEDPQVSNYKPEYRFGREKTIVDTLSGPSLNRDRRSLLFWGMVPVIYESNISGLPWFEKYEGTFDIQRSKEKIYLTTCDDLGKWVLQYLEDRYFTRSDHSYKSDECCYVFQVLNDKQYFFASSEIMCRSLDKE